MNKRNCIFFLAIKEPGNRFTVAIWKPTGLSSLALRDIFIGMMVDYPVLKDWMGCTDVCVCEVVSLLLPSGTEMPPTQCCWATSVALCQSFDPLPFSMEALFVCTWGMCCSESADEDQATASVWQCFPLSLSHVLGLGLHRCWTRGLLLLPG